MRELANTLRAVAAFLASTAPCAADPVTLDAFDRAVDALAVPMPETEKDPLSFAATVVSSNPAKGDSVIAVLKLRMLPGWYIYDYVPPSQPFIQTKWILEPGPELAIAADWSGPPSTPHKSLPDTRVHEAGPRELTFFREMKVTSADVTQAALEVGLRYQICNPEMCLPPKIKSESFTVQLSQGQ